MIHHTINTFHNARRCKESKTDGITYSNLLKKFLQVSISLSCVYGSMIYANVVNQTNISFPSPLKRIEKKIDVYKSVENKNILNKLNVDEKISPHDFLIGNYSTTNSNLIAVKGKGTVKPIPLRKEVFEAYKQMYLDAKKSKVELLLISGFRSYNAQKTIWNKKWKKILDEKTDRRFLASQLMNNIQLAKVLKSPQLQNEITKKVLQFSAVPGLSRHHWGTEIDINSLRNSYFLKTKEGKRVHAWLEENAQKYGFIRVYDGERNGGHKKELWHYSYYPSSIMFTAAHASIVKNNKMGSFLGSTAINLDDIYEEYFFSLNPKYIELSEKANLWPR